MSEPLERLAEVFGDPSALCPHCDPNWRSVGGRPISERRHTQAERERIANPPCTGSIPVAASNPILEQARRDLESAVWVHRWPIPPDESASDHDAEPRVQP